MNTILDSRASRADFARYFLFRSLLMRGILFGAVSPALALKANTPETTNHFEEVVMLSAFVVEASANSCVARFTPGCTCIRSDVADVGSSIFITTGQLMDDLVGTDTGSLLPLVTNAEVAGEPGNLSVGSTSSEVNVIKGWDRVVCLAQIRLPAVPLSPLSFERIIHSYGFVSSIILGQRLAFTPVKK